MNSLLAFNVAQGPGVNKKARQEGNEIIKINYGVKMIPENA